MEIDMTIKIRISRTMAYEYDSRAVYDFITKAGTYNLTQEEARELLEDALHNALHVDCMPQGAGRAYSALATNLMAQLDA
jgi:hypothetical protein